MDKPWSLSFIDQENIIFTEKSGKLYTLNLKAKKTSEIKHNLSVLEVGQGGLLDVLHDKGQIYISYSENRGDWKTSTSVAKGKFNQKNIEFKNIFLMRVSNSFNFLFDDLCWCFIFLTLMNVEGIS